MNGKNDTAFEDEVKEILNNEDKLRREKLIDRLIEKHTNQDENDEYHVDLGYSKPTINRKLNQMIKSKKIEVIKSDEFDKYGIIDSDKHASYLMTKEKHEFKKHFNNVLNMLSSVKEDAYRKLVVDELKRYQNKYTLDGKQIDILIKNLNEHSEDEELTYEHVEIILHSVVNKNVKL